MDTDENNEESTSNKLVRLLKLNRVYKIFRIVRLFKLVRIIKSGVYVKKLIGRLKLNKGIIRLSKFILTVCLIVHLLACLWYYLGKFEEPDRDT